MAILTPHPKNGFSRQSCNLIYIRTKLIWFLTVFKRYSWHVYIQSAWKKISTRKYELKSFWNKWKGGGGLWQLIERHSSKKKSVDFRWVNAFDNLTHSMSWRTRWVDAFDELTYSMNYLSTRCPVPEKRYFFFLLQRNVRLSQTTYIFKHPLSKWSPKNLLLPI